ncbi:MAG: filamentous hemagglutinin N-terminal domain-containing protein, partial [Burkholderiales bacterium]
MSTQFAAQLAVRPVARAVACALFASASPLWAGPAGEQVVAGQATVSRAGANTLINQTTDRAAINWQSFNIGVNESVRFAQPSSSSIALNRVLGQNPTEILGSLSANGQIFILNPNGVLFGKGAQVDVGGLVASTLRLSDSDFRAGRYLFVKDGNAGDVINQANIVANGGYVALIGPKVKNEGTIVAAGGGVAIAAGDQVTLNLNGNKLIGLTVDRGALNALADNKGLITADGGQVILTAKAADQLIKSVVNNDGVIEAGTLSNVNGVIRLEADNITNGGTLRAESGAGQRGGSITLAAANDITLGASSIISASGTRGGDITAQARYGTLLADGRIDAVGNDSAGGTVKLLGERVGLVNAVTVDASGKTGGGSVLVGGDYQGKNADVQNASRTYVGTGAGIKADAITSGDGGKVVIWADDATRYQGSVSAKGGANSGNGGFVEVSGKETLNFAGAVDTSAAKGNFGTLLLDPTNITVVAGAVPNPPAAADGLWAFGEDAGNQNIGATAINTLLTANNLTLQATNDITVGSAISYTGAATRTLTLQANNNINVSSAVATTTGVLNVVLNADADASGAGTAAITANITTRGGSVTATGASVTSTAAGTLLTTGTAAVAGGNVTITGIAAAGNVNLAGAITANGGNGGAGQAGGNAGNVSVTGALTVTTGAVTATGGNGGTGAGFVGGNGGAIAVSSNGTLITGALAATGGNGGGTTAAGGNAGTISVTNNAAAGGTVTTGTLAARAGAAVGATLSGLAGSVTVANMANALLQAGAIDTRGQAGGAGGNVSLVSVGNVTESSTIQTSGGALNAGTTAAGRNAGSVTITGVNRSVTGAITASGAAGLGTNQAGGNAGVVSITGTGTLTTNAITASTGAATGTGAGGAAGSITLNGTTVTTTGLTTTGAANGNGGTISVTSTTGATTINGAVVSSGGTANAGVAGRNAGTIIINSAGALTGAGLALTASGNNANGATLNLAGGNGALIDIDASGTLTVGAVAANGGNASTTNAAGGNAGTIQITNNSAGAGAITTGALTARNGAATGAGAGGTAGSVSVINNAAGQNISAGAINTSGQTSGAGGTVLLSSQGGVSVTSTIATSGAALGAGTTAAGRNAGSVTITGVNRSVTGAITASGAAGLGTNQAGGNAGVVSITG